MSLEERSAEAAKHLDEHVREMIQWHFTPNTGTPFWLLWAKNTKFDPLKEVQCYGDLKKFGHFEDEWLRGGPVTRWVPKGLADKPVFVFETGGTTGVPKSRISIDDFRIDYEMFSNTLPDQYFPRESNWLMLGPSGPRRLRLAVEHLAQHRGGICFCVDLDPRWVIKLIKKGAMDQLEAYQEHVIDQALTVLGAGHDIKCLFTTPKLCEALSERLASVDSSIHEAGITGIFCGGTEMNQQWCRFASEELLGPEVYLAPTYGNTLMGLAASKPLSAEEKYKISYYPPHPRAAVEVVDFDDYDRVVDYGETGRAVLTTLTKEFFMPRFPERDEGEREPPCDLYPWDGISGVRPFHKIAKETTVGVY
jgi:phenylacetate-coenzyme A ligase PaaK-like adenylate-forming protein